MKNRAITSILLLAFLLTIARIGIAQTQNEKIQQTVNVVKQLCLSGQQYDLKADASGNLTLRSLAPGGQGSVSVNVRESPGAVAYFNEQIKSGVDKDIRDCMAPYLKRIVDTILGSSHTRAECDSAKAACDTKTSNVFSKCIRREMNGCYDDCRRRGFPKDQCITSLCNYDALDSKARNFYDRRCRDKDDYQSSSDSCSDDYQACLSAL